MNQERPFISKSTDDLEIISNASRNNLDILKLIEAELKFRDSKKAQVLRTNVFLLIKNLESAKPTSKNIREDNGSDSLLDDIFIYEQGILRHCGYKVGLNGLGENQRRQILDRIFLYPLPSINDATYIKDWGEPGTEIRLKKLLDSIATFVRNAKRRNDKENYRKAIQDWEADLNYLKASYALKPPTPIEVEFNKLKKEYQKLLCLYDTEKTRTGELTYQRDEWQQRAFTNESQLVHIKQDIQTYQVEINELKQSAGLNFQKYLDEQKNYQKVLHDYDEAKAKANELVAQHDELQKRAEENQEAAYELIQVQLDLKIHQIKVNDLEESAAQNYQKYLDEQKNYQEALARYNEEKARATQLVAQRDEWEQRAVNNESQLVHVQQDVKTYQVEMNELKQRAALNFQKYLDEQKNSQKVLHDYHEAKAKATELITERDELQQRASANQKAAYELIQVRLDLQTYQVKVNDLEKSTVQNYQKYLDDQKNYQQALARYNEEKVRADELLAKYEQVSSERNNYLTLYNEAQTQLKFERRSKASIKGWETRRKAENERLKKEIAEMVVLLRDSLTSKDEAINNLYVVAERMDRIQSLVDSVEEDTISNPVGLVQKFKRIWVAIKEILSE